MAKVKAILKGALPTLIVIGVFMYAYNKSEKMRKLLGAAA